MGMGWSAAVTAVANAGSSYMQSEAAKDAARIQANAANRATDMQLGMFNTLNEQGAPYRTAGVQGLNRLSSLLGFEGSPTGMDTGQGHYSRPGKGYGDFWVSDAPKTYNDFYNSALEQASVQGLGPHAAEWAKQEAQKNFQASQAGGAPATGQGSAEYGSLLKPFTAADTYLAPNYKFRLEQGLGATENLMNRSGGLISGNTLRGVNDYAQNTAADAYGQAFDIYNTNQNNIFNRLSAIAGIGQVANANTAGAGTQISGNAAGSMMNAGAASAAGRVGSANALAGGINNAASWYTLSSMMGKGGSTGYDQNFTDDASRSMAESG